MYMLLCQSVFVFFYLISHAYTWQCMHTHILFRHCSGVALWSMCASAKPKNRCVWSETENSFETTHDLFQHILKMACHHTPHTCSIVKMQKPLGTMEQPEKNATLIKMSEWSRPFLFQWKTQQLCYVGVCRCCFYFCCCCWCIWGRKMYSVNETHHHFQRLRFLSSCCDCFCMCLLSGLWVCPWAAAVHLLRYIRGCIMFFSSPSFFWCSFLAYLNKTKYEKKWNGAVLCGFIFVDIFKRKNSSKPTHQQCTSITAKTSNVFSNGAFLCQYKRFRFASIENLMTEESVFYSLNRLCFCGKMVFPWTWLSSLFRQQYFLRLISASSNICCKLRKKLGGGCKRVCKRIKNTSTHFHQHFSN